ncbi:MAG: TolC family protein, partial [Myxococcales bacterium]
PDLQVALGNVLRAEAQQRVVLAQLLPQLSGTAGVSKLLARSAANRTTGDIDVDLFPSNATTYSAGLGLSVPVINLRGWYAQGTAEQQVQVAQLNVQEQRRLLALTVARALVAVITAERVVELNRIGLRGSLERLALTKRRSELGVANALDVLRLEQDVATSRATVISGDESLRQARETLGIALGVGEGYGVPRQVDLDAVLAETQQACGVVGTPEDRTDVVVAREQVELSKRAIGDVYRQFVPTVDLRSQYTLQLQSLANQFQGIPDLPTGYGAFHSWSVGLNLSWNIFDGGARYGQLRDARAQVYISQAQLQRTRNSASVDVTQARRGIDVADQARQVADDGRALAREAERLARVSFELGKGTSLELVDAARQLRQADVQLALREFDLVQARIRSLLAQANCTY